jgi:protein-tyrosine phosphatase
MYKDKGIKSFINLPVEDNNLEDYSEDNFQACKALDQLLEQKQRVYVHCTAGMSRA